MPQLPPPLLLALLLASCSGGSSGGPGTGSPPAPFDDTLHFTDAAATTGVEEVSFGRGAAMVDFDGDGLLDLAMANSGMPNGFYRQLPSHSFQDATQLWGLPEDQLAHWGLIAADFDNDGDADVFVANGGFDFLEPNQLLRNDLSTTGLFTDVSSSAGDVGLLSESFSATALDHDNDGLLDLFVSDSDEGLPGQLLHNLGGLVFTNVAATVGMGAARSGLGTSSGDFDNDGWMDVAVGAFIGANQLFHNQGNGTFLDVAAAAGVEHADLNFGLTLEDFNGDGWLDLFVPKYNQSGSGIPSRLYINTQGSTFVDKTSEAAMTGSAAMGHNTGDLNGDGLPEILIGTGAPALGFLDFLYKPVAGSAFLFDLSLSSGITSAGPTRAHGMAIGDIDGDGDVDVYFSNGGPQVDASTLESNSLWLNDGNATSWFGLALEGVVSNRSAIGARAAATTETGAVVYRYLRAGHGFGNTNSPVLHFGTWNASSVVRVDITWPSGIEQVLLAPEMSAVTEVLETGITIASDSTTAAPRAFAAGPAGATVDVVLGREGERAAPLASFMLGADGRAEVHLDALAGTAWRASSAWIQARIAPADGAPATLTPRLDLTRR